MIVNITICLTTSSLAFTNEFILDKLENKIDVTHFLNQNIIFGLNVEKSINRNKTSTQRKIDHT